MLEMQIEKLMGLRGDGGLLLWCGRVEKTDAKQFSFESRLKTPVAAKKFFWSMVY